MITEQTLDKLPNTPLWLHYFWTETPLEESSYLDKLADKQIVYIPVPNIDIGDDPYYAPRSLKQCAAEFAIQMFHTIQENDSKDMDDIISCYETAYINGIIETGNNLGILYESFLNDSETASKYFVDSAMKGNTYSMWNYFSLLWDRDKEEACEWLKTVCKMERPSLNCLLNYAILLYYGKQIEGNKLRKNGNRACKLIEFIIDFKNPNEDEILTAKKVASKLISQ